MQQQQQLETQSIGVQHDPLGAVTAIQDEQQFYKSIREFFNHSDDKIDFISDLTERDVINFSRADCLDKWSDHKVPIITLFMGQVKRMRVSQGRKGRTEFFDTFKPMGFAQAQNESQSFLGRIFGGKRE